MNRQLRLDVLFEVINPWERVRSGCWVAASTIVLAALFVACGGGSSNSAPPRESTKPPSASTTTGVAAFRDVEPTAADFVNLNKMAQVGEHFLASLTGHLDAALAIARSDQGGVYPVGTVLQLIPTEAMVKRRAGYSPTTRDWQFFSLDVSPQGTKIKSSGAEVKNFLGADCAACHSLAEDRFDFVCGKDHGCAPLGVTDQFIAAVQKTDPRPK